MPDPILLVAHNVPVVHGIHHEHANPLLLHQPGNGGVRPALHPALQSQLLQATQRSRKATAKSISGPAILYLYYALHLDDLSKKDNRGVICLCFAILFYILCFMFCFI